mgnify:CR=1 FL=1
MSVVGALEKQAITATYLAKVTFILACSIYYKRGVCLTRLVTPLLLYLITSINVANISIALLSLYPILLS